MPNLLNYYSYLQVQAVIYRSSDALAGSAPTIAQLRESCHAIAPKKLSRHLQGHDHQLDHPAFDHYHTAFCKDTRMVV